MSNYVSTHWGTYKYFKDKDKKIKLKNWELDSYPTKFGLGELNVKRTTMHFNSVRLCVYMGSTYDCTCL